MCVLFNEHATTSVSENNPEHKQLWDEFSERNLLRKMHLALNLVHNSSEEIQQMDSTEVKRVAEKALTSDPGDMKYFIEVLKLKEEFPMLASEKSQVYPLPLSFENQCTTMGAANNLSLFSEEFKFPCDPVERYIPVKKNSTGFDVDAAYERFAFLRTLSKHNEKQARYENILRKRGNDDSDNVEVPNNTIVGFVDSDSDTSGNLSD